MQLDVVRLMGSRVLFTVREFWLREIELCDVEGSIENKKDVNSREGALLAY